MNIKREITKYGLLLFPFTLSLPIPLNCKSIALVIFFILVLFNIKNSEIFNKQIVENKLTVIYIAFFCVELIVNFIRDYNLNFNDVRLSFLIAPLLFFPSKDVLLERKDQILKAFICGVYFYIIYAILFVIYFYGFYNLSQTFALNYYLKYVLYNYLPGAVHHTYMGMYITFAITILLYRINLVSKMKIGLVAPMFFALFFLGSKLSIIIGSLLLIFFLIQLFSVQNQNKIVVALVVLSAIFCYYFFYTDLFRTLKNSFNTRISFIQCSIEGLQKNWPLGIGRDNIKMLIGDCLTNSKGMDTHNIFLQEFLSTGIFGLGMLLLLLWTSFVEGSRNSLLILFLVMFLLYGQVEHLLSTQLGVTYFVFFSLLLQIRGCSGLNRKTTF